MRYRELDTNGDYTGFSGNIVFLVNSPQAVAQAVKTVLALMQGEWFLDQTIGVPYSTQILGTGTQATRDLVIQNAILGTQGVTDINQYSSQYNPTTRSFTVNCTIDTIYGPTPLSSVFGLVPPAQQSTFPIITPPLTDDFSNGFGNGFI